MLLPRPRRAVKTYYFEIPTKTHVEKGWQNLHFLTEKGPFLGACSPRDQNLLVPNDCGSKLS
jgi:hypothetical protein